MPLVRRALVLRLLPKVQRRKSELFSDLVRHIFQPRIIRVVKMQFLTSDRVDGIDYDMTVNGLRVGVGGDNTLTTFKHFLGASLGVLLNHKGVGVVSSVGRQLEVIIFSLASLRTFSEPCRCLPELLGIVLVLKQILHIHKPCLIFTRYVGDRLPRRCLARRTFQKRHLSFPR